MKMRYRYITYMLTGIALFFAIFITKDKIAEAANRIYLNETNLTLELGRYKTLKVYGSSLKPTFRSANSRAATVSSKGRVTAQGWGSTTVYTYIGNKTLKTKVTVVQMSKKNVALTPENTFKLSLWGSNNSTTWKSSNPKVATVSDNGLVTALKSGTATITASFNGKNITSEVSVIGLNHESSVLEYDGRFSLTRANFGSKVKLKVEGTNTKATWSSSNTKVATVDSKGKVTAQGPGNAKIYASLNGSTISADIKVLQMQYSEVELSKNQSYNLKVLGTDSEISWQSTKKSVAIVDDNGIVTAIGSGSAKIIAEVDGKLIRCIITVK